MLRHKAAKEAIRYAFGFSGISDEDDAHFIYENATVIEQEAPSSGAASIMDKAKALGEADSRPSHERDAQGPAEDATESGDWPRWNGNGHSETWRDVDGSEFDAQMHGWSYENDRPSVTQAGRFRKRRGSHEEVIEPESVASTPEPKSFAEFADEIRAAADEEALGVIGDLIAEAALPDDQKQELLAMAS